MILSVSQVSKSFGAKPVLKDASLRLDGREKVALVGRNGTGKTTLLKIITGELKPDKGTVHLAKGLTTGYLSQVSEPSPGETVLQAAEKARQHLVELETRIVDLEAKIRDHSTPEDLEEYALLQEHFHSEGGYSVERDVRTVLKRVGFSESQFDKPVSALSGGERTRLMLGGLLLEEPELLILDEPTNHLDLEATEWLESWLRGYGGAVLLVSHDRTFLNSVATRIVEVSEGTTKSYPGPFDKYLKLRQEEDARLAEVAKRQQIQMDKLDDFVRKFMNSERTAQARGRLRHLETLRKQAVVVPKKATDMKAGFARSKRSGDIVLETKSLSMTFGDQQLFQNLDWTVLRGERWGIVGANGIGKSTLIKILLKETRQTHGTFKVGSNVDIGYFSQDASNIDLDLTPLLTIHYECGLDLEQSRSLLGRLLIRGDEVFQTNRSLSGGERNKLALAHLVADQPNVLILDEPTNHLDMASRDALAEVLKEFDGTLLLISHDRWLLSEVTDHTLDLRHSGARIYPGSWAEYRRAQEARTPEPVGGQAREDKILKGSPLGQSPRELSKEIQRLTKEVNVREAMVSQLEMELERLERVMADPPEGTNLFTLTSRHSELKSKIDEAFQAWVESAARLDELRSIQSAPIA